MFTKISHLSFVDELLKVAFGPEQAAKVLALAKKLQLPKASSRLASTISGSPGAKQLMSDAAQTARPLGMVRASKAALKNLPQTSIVARTGRPTIFPGSGSIESQFRNATGGAYGKAPSVPPGQQKMLQAIVKGHEMDEAKVTARLGAAQFGHRSPDVLFREHNRVTTLPPGNESVKNFLGHYRKNVGEASLFPKQIPYGTGQRLSRHARKRLTELAEKKTIKDVRKMKRNFSKEVSPGDIEFL